jgi:predicted O-methyltransferase YrrM
MFEKLIWQKDRMLLGDLVFRLEHYKNDNWELGENCFRFFKLKELTDQYAKFFSSKHDFRPENVLELGTWDGGSVAFWFECFQPRRHVAIDLMDREDSAYFRRYVSSRRLQDRIKTIWRTDQADSRRVKQVVATNLFGSLDLVIDDASHLYGPTKSSFETLFPLLRPGGLYIIEDWAWAHWKGCKVGPPGSELTKLAFELVEAVGSTTELIAHLSIFEGFLAAERGEIEIPELGDFTIEGHIYRQPRKRRYSTNH